MQDYWNLFANISQAKINTGIADSPGLPLFIYDPAQKRYKNRPIGY